MSSLSSLHRRFSSNKRSNNFPSATSLSTTLSSPPLHSSVSSSPPLAPKPKRRSTLLEGVSSEWDHASDTAMTTSNNQNRKRWSWVPNGHEVLVPQPLIIKKMNSMNASTGSNSSIDSEQDPKTKASSPWTSTSSLLLKALPEHPPLENLITALEQSIASDRTTTSPIISPNLIRKSRPPTLDLGTLHEILEAHSTNWLRASTMSTHGIPTREIAVDCIPTEAALEEKRKKIRKDIRSNVEERKAMKNLAQYLNTESANATANEDEDRKKRVEVAN